MAGEYIDRLHLGRVSVFFFGMAFMSQVAYTRTDITGSPDSAFIVTSILTTIFGLLYLFDGSQKADLTANMQDCGSYETEDGMKRDVEIEIN